MRWVSVKRGDSEECGIVARGKRIFAPHEDSARKAQLRLAASAGARDQRSRISARRDSGEVILRVAASLRLSTERSKSIAGQLGQRQFIGRSVGARRLPPTGRAPTEAGAAEISRLDRILLLVLIQPYAPQPHPCKLRHGYRQLCCGLGVGRRLAAPHRYAQMSRWRQSREELLLPWQSVRSTTILVTSWVQQSNHLFSTGDDAYTSAKHLFWGWPQNPPACPGGRQSCTQSNLVNLIFPSEVVNPWRAETGPGINLGGGHQPVSPGVRGIRTTNIL